ncbi:MAG TPA: pantoate--beta-alanine ligase [Patescibacteria group bacterium]|nr:pantoate--beta-alanine ligase [Patescibacteria group bacterium]
MEMIKRTTELKKRLAKAREKKQTVGLVPTMGYLHEGHLTLMRQAKRENDLVVSSIFVNPLQFGPDEDYEAYPRDLAKDEQLAAGAGVDLLFAPEVADMYPNGFGNMAAYVDVDRITKGLCGASRPGHFRGVATVVSKLFHIVNPDTAYFGQKDAQQVAVIRQMVADLNMEVRVVSVPIVREADGLALSSRNVYLSPVERQAARVLSQSLHEAQERLKAGEKNLLDLLDEIRKQITCEPLIHIDYVTAVDAYSFQELSTAAGDVLLAVAAKVGRTRLIDNIIWKG